MPSNPSTALLAISLLATVGVGQSPAQAPQQEPTPRRFYVPGGTTRWWGEVGVGTFAFDAPGTVLDDRTNARSLRVGVDGTADLAAGYGLELRAIRSDNDLFEGRRINDGTTPQLANAEVSGLQAFPHHRLDCSVGELTVPLRLGVLADYLSVEHESAAIDREWWSFGFAATAETRLPLTVLDGYDVDLFGRLGADVGMSRFEESFGGGGDSDLTWRWGYRAALGLRWHRDNWAVDLGYELGQTRFHEKDTRLFRSDGDLLVEQQMVFLGGVIWH